LAADGQSSGCAARLSAGQLTIANVPLVVGVLDARSPGRRPHTARSETRSQERARLIKNPTRSRGPVRRRVRSLRGKSALPVPNTRPPVSTREPRASTGSRIHGELGLTRASRAGCSGAANEIVDEGAAARGVLEERGMTARDDLEASVGYELARAPADLRSAVGALPRSSRPGP
jgi:hypothetical protein